MLRRRRGTGYWRGSKLSGRPSTRRLPCRRLIIRASGKPLSASRDCSRRSLRVLSRIQLADLPLPRGEPENRACSRGRATSASRTVGVVGKCFDNAAIGDLPAATAPDHALEPDRVTLEDAQSGFPPAEVDALRCGRRPRRSGRFIRQTEEFPDSIQREAHFPAVGE